MATPPASDVELEKQIRKEIKAADDAQEAILFPFPFYGAKDGHILSVSAKLLKAWINQSTNPQGGKKPPPPWTHIVFILDRSASMGTNFSKVLMPACYSLCESVKTDSATAVFFGSTVEVFEVKNKSLFKDKETMKLQGSTNIGEAFEKAIQEVGKHDEKFRHTHDVTYFFIFMSDGEDTVTRNAEELRQRVEKASAELTRRSINSMLFCLGIGETSDTRIGMKCKSVCENIVIGEITRSVHYARTPGSLAKAISTLTGELGPLLDGKSVHIVASPRKSERAGFVVDLSEYLTLANRVDFRVPAEEKDSLFLICGRPDSLSLISNNGITTKIKFRVSSNRPLDIDVTRVIRFFARRIRINLVARVPVACSLTHLQSMVKAVPGYRVSEKDMVKSVPIDRVEMMKRPKREIIIMETIVNRLMLDFAGTDGEMTQKEAAIWLNHAALQQYSAFSWNAKDEEKNFSPQLHNQVVTDLTSLANEVKGLKNAGAFTGMQERSTISGWGCEDFLEQLQQQFVRHLPNLNIQQILHGIGMVGILIRTVYTDQAKADPWQVRVKHVSDMVVDTASCCMAMDLGLFFTDPAAIQGQEALVLIDSRNPEPYKLFLLSRLHQVYTSVVVAREPGRFSKVQYAALYLNCIRTACGQLWDPVMASRSHIKNIFEMALTLREILGDSIVELKKSWDAESNLALAPAGKGGEEEDKEERNVLELLGALLFFGVCSPRNDNRDNRNNNQTASAAPPSYTSAVGGGGVKSKEGEPEEEPGAQGGPQPPQQKSPKDDIGAWFASNDDPTISALTRRINAMSLEAILEVTDTVWEKMTDPLGAVSISTFLKPFKAPKPQAKPTNSSSSSSSASSSSRSQPELSPYMAVTQSVLLELLCQDARDLHIGPSHINRFMGIKTFPTVKPDNEDDPDVETMKFDDSYQFPSTLYKGSKRLFEKSDRLDGTLSALRFISILHQHILPMVNGFEGLQRALASEDGGSSLIERVREVFPNLRGRTVVEQICVEAAPSVPIETHWCTLVVLAFRFAEMRTTPSFSFSTGRMKNDMVEKLKLDLTTPEGVDAAMRNCASWTRKDAYLKDLKAKQARLAGKRKEDRIDAMLAQEEELRQVHVGLPRVFTRQQITEMNLGREPDDQLEVSPTGMLLHHCGYPSCPQYLQCFALPNDIRKGRRHGLWAHIRHVTGFVPGMHLTATKILAADAAITKSAFTAKMFSILERRLNLKGGQTREGYTRDFHEIYDTLKKSR